MHLEYYGIETMKKGAEDMSENRGGVLGNIFNGDCAILFFILVFLCLFTGFGGYGYGCCKE